MKCGQTVDDLISAIYPDLHLVDPTQDNATWFAECAILSSLNGAVDDLNDKCLDAIPGNLSTYHSADKAIINDAADDEFQYPTEYLNTITASGLPLSKLQLNPGVPLMVC